MFQERGMYYCEVCGCPHVTFAHKHKRRWYYGQDELLWSFDQVLLLCVTCHEKIEFNEDAKNYLFDRLRPKL